MGSSALAGGPGGESSSSPGWGAGVEGDTIRIMDPSLASDPSRKEAVRGPRLPAWAKSDGSIAELLRTLSK